MKCILQHLYLLSNFGLDSSCSHGLAYGLSDLPLRLSVGGSIPGLSELGLWIDGGSSRYRFVLD